MKLRQKFLLFVLLIHILFVILSVFLLFENRYLFVAAELVILLSAAVSFHLYRSFLKPLNLLSAGIESIRDRDFSSTFVKTGQFELDSLIDIYNRMIEQLRDERVKQEQQHFFLRRLLEASPMGVVILDLDNRVESINPAASAMLLDDAVPGRNLVNSKSLLGSELASIEDGETKILSLNGIQTFKCHRSHFLDRGFKRNFIMIEELTREIMAMQKKAYEKVIRMMSHEINNSVGAINSILQSSLSYGNQLNDDDRKDFEEAIRVAIDRNRGLNTFMANFADVVRIPKPSREECDLHDLLRSVHVLMSSECRRRSISWEWHLSRAPFVVDIDVRQIEQVAVNVIRNALEAISRNGTIVVRTTSSVPRKLMIINNGRGIAPEDRSNLFTPFYSTKRSGQGVGLTLTREILINHGCSFNLETDVCGQTVFWIEFPLARSTSHLATQAEHRAAEW